MKNTKKLLSIIISLIIIAVAFPAATSAYRSSEAAKAQAESTVRYYSAENGETAEDAFLGGFADPDTARFTMEEIGSQPAIILLAIPLYAATFIERMSSAVEDMFTINQLSII